MEPTDKKRRAAPAWKLNAARVLSEEEQRGVLAALRQLMYQRFDNNESKAARKLDISQQVVNTALKTGRVGRGLAAAIAKEMGVSMEKLVASLKDRWPNRSLAVELAKEHGVSEAGIAAVLAEPWDGTKDISRVAWVLEMVEQDAELKKPKK